MQMKLPHKPRKQALAERVPKQTYGQLVFLAVQDAQGQSYFLDESKTPWRGWALYPELRYRVSALTGRRPILASKPPGLPRWLVLDKICLIVVIFQTPWMILTSIGGFCVGNLIEYVVRRWGRSKRRKRQQQGLVENVTNGLHLV